MISKFLKQHPILRGMLTYSVLYPSSNATQQAFDPQKSKVDLKECGRFWIMGTFVVAPSLYGWVKVSSIIVKGNKFKNCLLRAYVEQLVWAPFAYTQFFLVINLLEGKSFRESLEQLKEKFWPTYKVGFCVWPLLQTLNFWIVPEKNRVPFIAVYSFAWNIFLSYVHHRSWKQNTTQVS